MTITDFVCRVDDTDPDEIITNQRSALSCFGEMYFNSNLINTLIFVIDTPVKVGNTYTAGKLRGFTHSNGILTYTDTETRDFRVSCSMTVRAGGASLEQYNFYGFLDGSKIDKTKYAVYCDNADANVTHATVQFQVELIENNTLAVYVENADSTQNVLIENLNFTVSRI